MAKVRARRALLLPKLAATLMRAVEVRVSEREVQGPTVGVAADVVEAGMHVVGRGLGSKFRPKDDTVCGASDWYDGLRRMRRAMDEWFLAVVTGVCCHGQAYCHTGAVKEAEECVH